MRLWFYDLNSEDRLAAKIAQKVWEGFVGESTVDMQTKVTPTGTVPSNVSMPQGKTVREW